MTTRAGRYNLASAPPALLGPAPCDNCANYTRCATRFLACQAFRYYVDRRMWRTAPREPSKEIFARLYDPRFETLDAEVSRVRQMKQRQLATITHRGSKPGRKPNRAMGVSQTC